MNILDHPLISDRLARLRESACDSARFRSLVGQVAQLMVPAVTADLPTRPTTIETPLEPMEASLLAHPIVLVPILRAGLSLAEGFIATPEGASKLAEIHPDVPLFAAALDRELDDNGYIRPGLGDAGDRAFGTA